MRPRGRHGSGGCAATGALLGTLAPAFGPTEVLRVTGAASGRGWTIGRNG